MSGADTTLEDLLLAVANEDRTAFATLYQRTSAKLFAIVLRILPDKGQAEDAMQDVFVRVWRSAQGYDASRGKPITWLATIARNIAIDVRRRDGARGSGREVELEAELFTYRPEGASAETLASLRACLDRMDPDQRQLIVAAYMRGESREDLAMLTGRPLGTIKSWLHRGLAALKGCLDG